MREDRGAVAVLIAALAREVAAGVSAGSDSNAPIRVTGVSVRVGEGHADLFESSWETRLEFGFQGSSLASKSADESIPEVIAELPVYAVKGVSRRMATGDLAPIRTVAGLAALSVEDVSELGLANRRRLRGLVARAHSCRGVGWVASSNAASSDLTIGEVLRRGTDDLIATLGSGSAANGALTAAATLSAAIDLVYLDSILLVDLARPPST